MYLFYRIVFHGFFTLYSIFFSRIFNLPIWREASLRNGFGGVASLETSPEGLSPLNDLPSKCLFQGV